MVELSVRDEIGGHHAGQHLVELLDVLRVDHPVVAAVEDEDRSGRCRQVVGRRFPVAVGLQVFLAAVVVLPEEPGSDHLDEVHQLLGGGTGRGVAHVSGGEFLEGERMIRNLKGC